MTILENNPIPGLVAQYRKLKAQADAIKMEMDAVKDKLRPVVEDSGNWKDTDGYARITTRKPSVSFNGEITDTLAKTWLASDIPAVCDCGRMLAAGRKEKAGYSYLQVR